MASPRGQQAQKAAKAARRAWPYLMMAYERWQRLTPEQRERYLAQARRVADTARRRGGGGGLRKRP